MHLFQLSFGIIFFLGITKESDQMHIDKESEIYKDIAQKNYIDSYRNLTLKVQILCESKTVVLSLIV